ncbi:MAG: hypothetical protein J6Y11_07730 [Paludibacteraceae bacterium]|nr:hypothetical protein [Paludibacteraceae bacterium]
MIMIEKSDIAIVVPIYKLPLSPDDRICLNQLFKVMTGYDIYAIYPEKLDITDMCREYPLLIKHPMESSHFSSLRSYNKLVLSSSFYDAFSNYKYILINQLDTYIFKDELCRWANSGFDYVGAPFVPDKDKYWSPLRRLWCRLNFYLCRYKGTDPHHSQWYQVGNGGLCLRNVSKFQNITKKYKQQIEDDLSDEKDFYPEDLWLSFELKGDDRLKTPDWKTALHFSVECSPQKCMDIIGNKLPFGTHAWTLDKHRPFWEKYIK